MNVTAILAFLLMAAFGLFVVSQNTAPYTVSMGRLEITATVGIICASAFGLGLLTGVLAMLTKDVPRMRALSGSNGDEE